VPETNITLTPVEQKIKETIQHEFTEEQMCAFFLTKTIRSQYQFDDDFIIRWYEEIFNKKPVSVKNSRRELVKAYTQMLMFENKYKFHLDYWLRQCQGELLSQMEIFFGAEPGK
jgi:hypothetical protein